MVKILIIGTYDTKHDELTYLEDIITSQNAETLKMDVSILGDDAPLAEISKHDVAKAANSSIDTLIAYDDENLAFQAMAKGAAHLAGEYYKHGEIDAMIALGGTMGTDLALDVASILPMGVPKYIISTVAFSPLISAERIAPDVQMILWAGGLYGLNSLCKSTLSQAGGAIVGAAKAVEKQATIKPMVGMTSLGKTTLRYMEYLLPELKKRGFDVAIFHSTGLGGRAFESLAAQGRFACVMDFCIQEFVNFTCGSPVHSGADRMLNAGQSAIPQMIAPGASDIIDCLATAPLPSHLEGRTHHAHNRLIESVMATDEERAHVAEKLAECLSKAKAPVYVFLPQHGLIEWDKPEMPLHNPKGLARFLTALEQSVSPVANVTKLDCHINDRAFADAVLKHFDKWLDDGVIKT